MIHYLDFHLGATVVYSLSYDIIYKLNPCVWDHICPKAHVYYRRSVTVPISLYPYLTIPVTQCIPLALATALLHALFRYSRGNKPASHYLVL